MKPLTVLVIADPTARHLSVLKNLPDETTIVVGTQSEAFQSAAGQADVILTTFSRTEPLRTVMRMAPNVQWIHSLSAGVENTLFPELIESPLPLTNSRGIYARSLGEFAMSAILFFAKDLRRMLHNQQARRWEQFDVEEIHRQTLGIIGYGEIGRSAAIRAHAFGMKILGVRRRPELSKSDPILDEIYSFDQRADVMRRSDYVLAAAPLTSETRGLIGEAELGAMKQTGVIINLGRGPVIDAAALIRALENRTIRGAALDVFDQEPLPESHPFWGMENVLLSPHCADHTATWLFEAMEFFVSNFERFRTGEPLANIVDKNAGY
jgi:phosphoglycerate dehydrogenase-like enzyme